MLADLVLRPSVLLVVFAAGVVGAFAVFESHGRWQDSRGVDGLCLGLLVVAAAALLGAVWLHGRRGDET